MLEQIISRFPVEMKTYTETGEFSDLFFDALYSYYLSTGEMPYGTAKARTGDPYEWIADRLDNFLTHH